MKKLMFGIAALSAGICLADVTSANIVGYLNQDLIKGAQYKGPQFVAIGHDGKMSDVKISGYTGDIDAEFVTISKINAYGVNYKNIMWLDVPSDEVYGWYQIDEQEELVDCNDDELLACEGLMVNAQEDATGWDFVNAGEVAQDGVAVTLIKGAQYLACATPRKSTCGEIHVSGYTGDIDAEFVTISKINAYGVNYKNIMWLDVVSDDVYGWYQIDEQEELVDCNEDELDPGEGLMVNVQEDAVGWTITFPPAIPEEK